jgi:MtN3 and saliva related transmembrane protein
MSAPAIEALGYVAALCTTLAFAPQAFRVWTRRRADDISLAMYVVMLAGVALWMVYGWLIRSVPLVAANGATCVLAGAVLAGKLRFR